MARKLRSPLGLVPLVMLGVIVFGGSLTPVHAGSSTSIKPPAAIVSAGQISFCSSIDYPPLEFFQGATPVGADIDVAKNIAKRMGVKAAFSNIGFDGLIAALLAKKCDIVIAGAFDTPQRRQVVNFVDYMRNGESILVPKGNPNHIRSLASLSGLAVAVQIGTVLKSDLDAENAKLAAAGQKSIQVIAFPVDTDALNALRTHKVDALFVETPPAAYYVKQAPSDFQIVGPQIDPHIVGMMVRKDAPALQKAVQKAINLMYADGTIKKILATWDLRGAALR